MRTALFTSSLLAAAAFASQPNPPTWDSDRVLIFDPADTDCQTRIDAVWFEMGTDSPDCYNGQWSDNRYALMFKPGTHNCYVNVGYYTQVLGLGSEPTDTTLAALYVPDSCGSALNNFWRGVENVDLGHDTQTSVMWHVSQAAPMRRVNVVGDMELGQGYASGGYMANSKVSGRIYSNSQQQWLTRNTEMDGGFQQGAWNFVFVGCTGDVPASDCGGESGGVPATTISETPIIAEKPFININDDGTYTLNIPNYVSNTSGYNWVDNQEVDFSEVYVASDSDSAATINSYLSQGLHVVMQPGNYYLDEALTVGYNGSSPQVLLGLGMATLISTNGNACIEVIDASDSRIAGFLLGAGVTESETLLKWGTSTSSGNASAPGVISDVFARVGGTNDNTAYEVTTQSMMEINNQFVIIDHTWLWRADHDIGGDVSDSRNYVSSGLIVNADNVKAYALFAEHTLGDLVAWNGSNGEVYFYQSELPYDVTQDNYADAGYVGFYVGENATNFKGYGIAVYSYFRDYTVWMDQGITAQSDSYFENSFIRFLDGNGGFYHVINDQGDGAQTGSESSYLCSYTDSYESFFLQ